jgi:hypothetical protein
MNGNKDNIPTRISDRVKNTEIIYWSSPDQESPLIAASFLGQAAPLCVFPCLWPHLLIMSPCFLGLACSTKTSQLGTDIVLTSSTLEVIQESGTTTSIPLENIKSVTTATKSNVPCYCGPEISRIIIDDGRTVHTKHGLRPIPTVLVAHENIEELCRLILEAKEKHTQMGTIAATQAMMQQMAIMQQQMTMSPLVMQPPGMYQQQPVMGQQPQPGMYQQPVMYQPNHQPVTYPPKGNNAYPEVELESPKSYPEVELQSTK